MIWPNKYQILDNRRFKMFINDIFKKKTVTESLRRGEYYTFQVFFDDGTDETLNFSSDDIDWDRVGAKRGKQVVDIERLGGIQGSQSDTPDKPHEYSDDRGLAQAQRAYDRKIPEGGFDIPEIPRAPTPKPPKEKDVAKGSLNEFAPGDGDSGRWYSDDDLADIVGEDWYEFDVSHEMGNIGTQGERARIFLAREAESYLQDRGYNVNVLDVRDQGDNLSWYISGSLMNEQGLAEESPYMDNRPSSVTAKQADQFGGAAKRAFKPEYYEPDTEPAPKSRNWDYNDPDVKPIVDKYLNDKILDKKPMTYKQDVPEDFDDTSPHTSYVQSNRTVTSKDGKDHLSDRTSSLSTDKSGNQRVRAVDGDKLTINTNIPKGVNVKMISQQGDADIDEGSVQDRLHRRHQELRKKSGLPNPDYYKELRATYDLPDEERYAKAAELKKKYKVTNEDRERYLEEMRRAGYDIVTERATLCPECGGPAFEDRMLAEKQDACYHKVKSRYKVWPSAYASGALVRCRKKGAANWGNKSKK